MKTEQLTKYVPIVAKDARAGLEALEASSVNDVVSAPDIWRTVFRQNARLAYNNRAVDDPVLFKQYVDNVGTLLHTYSPFNTLFNWLPEPAYIRRRLARWRLVRLVTAEVDKRMAPGAAREDDPLQILLDNGDKKDFIIEFFVSILFITTTNAHVISGHLLNIMAIHPDWQEKIWREIKTAVDTHAKHRHGTVADRLQYLDLNAWETSFPILNLCMKEAIRMWTSFSVTRLNTSPNAVPIPGTNEVIPSNTFVIYNSTEVNFNEELYPNPGKFDPERYLEGREEFKKETYGCKYCHLRHLTRDTN
jgi:cytochrome P450